MGLDHLLGTNMPGDTSSEQNNQTQLQADLDLFRATAPITTETKSLEEALQKCLDLVCGYVGWPVGHVYVPSPDVDDRLVSARIWHFEGGEHFQNFRDISEQITFDRGVGLPGRVLESGVPAWIEDVQLDENFPRNRQAVDLGVHGAFAFPIKVGGELVAVLEFFSQKPEAPNPRILYNMELLGSQPGGLLERKRAEDSLRERAAEAQRAATESETLAEIGRIISSSVDIESAYPRFADLAHQIVEFERLTIAIIDCESNRGTVAFSKTYGTNPISVEIGETFDLYDSVTGRVVRTRETILVSHEEAAQISTIAPLEGAEEQAYLATPMISQDRAIGCLILRSSHQKNYNEADISLIKGISNQIAGAAGISTLYSNMRAA